MIVVLAEISSLVVNNELEQFNCCETLTLQ